jgi:hypothetical protein
MTTGMAESLWDMLSSIVTLPGGWSPLRIRDGAALPAGTYQRISGVPYATTHSGGTEQHRRRFQLTIYSERYSEGREAAKAVVAAMNGTRGDWDGYDVIATLADDAEDIDPDPRGLFRQRVDVMLGSDAP